MIKPNPYIGGYGGVIAPNGNGYSNVILRIYKQKLITMTELEEKIDYIVGCNTDVTDSTHEELCNKIKELVDEQVKLFAIPNVRNRRELLIAFLAWYKTYRLEKFDINHMNAIIEQFEKCNL